MRGARERNLFRPASFGLHPSSFSLRVVMSFLPVVLFGSGARASAHLALVEEEDVFLPRAFRYIFHNKFSIAEFDDDCVSGLPLFARLSKISPYDVRSLLHRKPRSLIMYCMYVGSVENLSVVGSRSNIRFPKKKTKKQLGSSS